MSNLERKDSVRSRVDPFRLPNQPEQNPFLPYDPNLFVADLSPTHVCLLNKFSVVEHHLLIVTRAFEEQQRLLGLEDFEALWRCLDSIDGLGFYNAGEAAGASQRHKHLQLVPLPLAPSGPGVPIEPLLGDSLQAPSVCTSAALPFVHALLGAPRAQGSVRKAAEATLARYHRLLRATSLVSAEGPLPPTASAPYNLLVTREWMLLAPRSREYVGPISVNALGFAGAMLVRTQDDLAHLKALGPMAVLRDAGVPTGQPNPR